MSISSAEPSAGDATNAHFVDFYRREYPDQVRRAYLLTRSNEIANDVVQDAMAGLYRRWGEVESPAAYLNRSVLNACRDVARRTATEDRIVHRLSDTPSPVSERDVLDDILARLPFNHRAAVVLRFYGGWSADDIAEALDCSPNSVGPWIRRALDRMREELT